MFTPYHDRMAAVKRPIVSTVHQLYEYMYVFKKWLMVSMKQMVRTFVGQVIARILGLELSSFFVFIYFPSAYVPARLSPSYLFIYFDRTGRVPVSCKVTGASHNALNHSGWKSLHRSIQLLHGLWPSKESI